MRNFLCAFAVVAAVSFTPASSQATIFALFGFDPSGQHNCGCKLGGCGCGNCCDPGCGCGGCGCGTCCEPACGCCDCGGCCEPCCGCGTGCFPNGRRFAGQRFNGCCRSHAPVCPCVDCGGCCDPCCGCGNCCEPGCGCGDCGCGNCCEPVCGCGDGCCGKGTACRPYKCCLKNVGFGSCWGCALNAMPCRSGCGCNGEVYWNEWHNDPPCCHDPCNCCGEWNGPSAANCGPSGCPCEVGSAPAGGYVARPMTSPGGNAAYARNPLPNPSQTLATNRGPYSAKNNRQFAPAHQTRPAFAGQNTYQSSSNRTAARPVTSRLPVTNRPSTHNNSLSNTQRPIMW